MKKIILVLFLLFVFGFLNLNSFATTAKDPKTDHQNGSGSIGPCSYTYMTTITHTDLNKDGVYDHTNVDVYITWNCGWLGSGSKTIHAYEGNFSFRGNDGSGYPNYDPSIDIYLDDLIESYSQTVVVDTTGPEVEFYVNAIDVAYMDLDSNIVGEYIKYTSDSIPLYTSYRVSTQGKISLVNDRDDGISSITDGINNATLPVCVFPNPSKSKIYFSLGNSPEQSDEVIKTCIRCGINYLDYLKIIDINGKEVICTQGVVDFDQLPYCLDISNLPEGVYIIETRFLGYWKGSTKIILNK